MQWIRKSKIFCSITALVFLFIFVGCNAQDGKNDTDRKDAVDMQTVSHASIPNGESDMRSVNVRSFGAVGDGAADDSQAIRDAISSLEKTGGTVFLPAGVYRMKKSVEVPVGVNIEGVTYATTGPWQQYLDAQDKNLNALEHELMQAPGDSWLQFDMYKGTWILVDHGAGNVNAPPTFQLCGGSSIRKIGFVHKGLPPITGQVVEYPPAIGAYSNMGIANARDGITVEDISLANPYVGIAFVIGDDLKNYYLDKTENDIARSFGRHRIHNIMGGPINNGIMLKGLLDTVDISNIQFNYSNYEGRYVASRAQKCTDIEIARADGIAMNNILSFGARYGLRTVPAFQQRMVSLRATNLNLEAQIPMSLKSSGQYEITNSYFLTLNFANLVKEGRFACIEVETDKNSIHQSHFMFNNLFFQNSIMAPNRQDLILDITLDRGSNAIMGNSMFWGWDQSEAGDSVIRFTHRSGGPASFDINNSTFTNIGLKGTLVEVGGNGYKSGDVRFSDCRIPVNLKPDEIAQAAKVWFNNCVVTDDIGNNRILTRN